MKHLMYVPFLGLGLYGGYRGRRFLKNRIKIFKQFVIPSLSSQTNKDFILWISWRYEDRKDPLVLELEQWLNTIPKFCENVVFTYCGVCFFDDKYPDEEAYARLVNSVHGSMGELLNHIGECKDVLMSIQPSDDVYHSGMVQETQDFFKGNSKIQVYGYKRGYVMDYINRRLSEWNPQTTPPFYTIRFPRETFTDPLKHLTYIGPYRSHEFVKDYLPAHYSDTRGFIVGTHGMNISTVFDHPYTGHEYLGDNVEAILSLFGLRGVAPLKLYKSIRSDLFNALPYSAKRKLRYWAEKNFLFSWVYNFLRS